MQDPGQDIHKEPHVIIGIRGTSDSESGHPTTALERIV